MFENGIEEIFLSALTAFLLTYFALPSIIHIARVKNLVDEPGERRSHVVRTPSLGGIGIFAGVLFSVVLWTPLHAFGDLQYILAAFIIIFLIGAKDDIIPIVPGKKLAGQLLSASILVFKSGIMLTSFYGIFGIHELPYGFSVLLSIFTILVIINAFNLIDGINGLSGSIGCLISVFFGLWFFLAGRLELALIAFSLLGALIAFLRYNITPAKIFMGDTGALFIGLICAILAIEFIEMHQPSFYKEFPQLAFNAAPAIAIGILILPLFDTLRVFTMRLFKGKSPLHPDRTHIHHLLIDTGFTHMQATGLLLVVNVIFIVVAISFQHIGSMSLLLLILVFSIVLSTILSFTVTRKQQERPSSSASNPV